MINHIAEERLFKLYLVPHLVVLLQREKRDEDWGCLVINHTTEERLIKLYPVSLKEKFLLQSKKQDEDWECLVIHYISM